MINLQKIHKAYLSAQKKDCFLQELANISENNQKHINTSYNLYCHYPKILANSYK